MRLDPCPACGRENPDATPEPTPVRLILEKWSVDRMQVTVVLPRENYTVPIEAVRWFGGFDIRMTPVHQATYQFPHGGPLPKGFAERWNAFSLADLALLQALRPGTEDFDDERAALDDLIARVRLAAVGRIGLERPF